MKKILNLSVALAVCLWAGSAWCDVKIDGATWRGVEKFNPSTLSTTLGDHVGKLIAVQFNFRGKDIHHMKPNWYEGSIWQPDAKARKGFSNIRILVPKKDLAGFTSITADSKSTVPLMVYGRVERDADSNFFFVRLFGSKVALDSAHNASVSW